MTEDYTGRAHYFPDHEYGHETLFVAVACDVGDQGNSIHALLDTGAQWCILPAAYAIQLGYDLTPDPKQPRYSTRYGLLDGRLERVRLRLPADEGDDLELDATFFLTADWYGPPVLGWKGCLERIRFSLNPAFDALWFSFANL